MKIVDLKCPSCGGKLIPVEGNSKIVCCEYCKSQFVLEEDQIINYHIHQYGSTPPAQPERFSANTGGDFSAKSAGIAVAALAIAILSMISLSVIRGSKKDAPPTVPASAFQAVTGESLYDIEEGDEENLEAEMAYSPLYEQILGEIFQKPADTVTAKELDTLKYLSIELGSDTHRIRYSFEDPYESDQAQIYDLETGAVSWDPGDWAAFTGLVKADLGSDSYGLEAIGTLEHLKGLACYRAEFSSLAEILPAEQILELDVDHPEGLEGIGDFQNLEILRLEDVRTPDLKQLVTLKNLRSLTIEEYFDSDEAGALTNYSALSVLTSLEHLALDSEAIRELSFLKPLGKLTSLSIQGTECLGIEPLGELTQLTSLELGDNDSVTDYSPLKSLTGLKTLTIDKNTTCNDPDLSSLGNLEELEKIGRAHV